MEASFVYEDQLGNHHTDARCPRSDRADVRDPPM